MIASSPARVCCLLVTLGVNDREMDRNRFIRKSIVLGSLAATAPISIMAHGKSDTEDLFDTEAINELVSAAHKSLDDTRKIIEAKPLLLNCASQISKGDFETAMGGASHMGRRDIVDLLISKGARMDIFSYAFLGYDDFIRKQITEHPKLLNSPGPHGFTLLHHAEVGDREELAEWLRSKGLTQTIFKGIFG